MPISEKPCRQARYFKNSIGDFSIQVLPGVYDYVCGKAISNVCYFILKTRIIGLILGEK